MYRKSTVTAAGVIDYALGVVNEDFIPFSSLYSTVKGIRKNSVMENPKSTKVINLISDTLCPQPLHSHKHFSVQLQTNHSVNLNTRFLFSGDDNIPYVLPAS